MFCFPVLIHLHLSDITVVSDSVLSHQVIGTTLRPFAVSLAPICPCSKWCFDLLWEVHIPFPYPQERERMLIAATGLANCCNLPSAEKLNWLLSPSIELVASSSFSLLYFSFFALCQSLSLSMPLQGSWLVNVSGSMMMARESTGCFVDTVWCSLYCAVPTGGIIQNEWVWLHFFCLVCLWI